MASKFECREVFWKQPAYFLILDISPPMDEHTFENICTVIKNIIALALSMKGSPRISTLGVCCVSKEFQSVFSMQALKSNFGKLYDALDNAKNNFFVFGCSDSCKQDWKSYIKETIQQYENYFEGIHENSKEWPPLQITIFSAQRIMPFTKEIKKALSASKKSCLKKVQIVNVYIESSQTFQYTTNTFDEDCSENNSAESCNDIDVVVDVTAIDNNVIQMEMIFKMWLHDTTTESEHLKIIIKENHLVLHCDIRETVLNPDYLPGNSNFVISVDAGFSQLVQPNRVKQGDTRIQIYQLEAVDFVARSGICQSVIYGMPIIIRATQCWKMEWGQLHTNQQIFNILKHYLDNQQLVLITKKLCRSSIKNTIIPTGYFAVFPTKSPGILLLTSIASQEHLMPSGQDHVLDSSMPDEMVQEMTKIFQTFNVSNVYNPLAAHAGLYQQMSTTQLKNRPSWRKKTEVNKQKKNVPSRVCLKPCIIKPDDTADKFGNNKKVSFGPDFMKASQLTKQSKYCGNNENTANNKKV